MTNDRDICNEIPESETPIFTEENVYVIAGFVAGTILDRELEPEELQRVVKATDEGIQHVLS